MTGLSYGYNCTSSSKQRHVLPGNDVQLAAVETRYEIGILLFLNYLLELEREPEMDLHHDTGESIHRRITYSRAISVLSESTTSLIMITKVDWKSAGFATGSKTVELD